MVSDRMQSILRKLSSLNENALTFLWQRQLCQLGWVMFSLLKEVLLVSDSTDVDLTWNETELLAFRKETRYIIIGWSARWDGHFAIDAAVDGHPFSWLLVVTPVLLTEEESCPELKNTFTLDQQLILVVFGVSWRLNVGNIVLGVEQFSLFWLWT